MIKLTQIQEHKRVEMKQLYVEMTYLDTQFRVFWNGRIDAVCKKTTRHGVKGEWITRTNKPDKRGYPRITIDGKTVKVHRLILLAYKGESELEVDHKNQIKTDNRLCNLHYVTHLENNLNKDWVYNARGYRWCKANNKWRAEIGINGKSKHLGLFDKKENARNAYLEAKQRLGRL